MAEKTVPLSVRINEADAEFLARLQRPGAVSPSEKLRSLLAEAREREASLQDYSQAYVFARNLVGPTLQRVITTERETKLHSQLVSQVLEWLPEILGFVLATASSNRGDLSQRSGSEAEKSARSTQYLEQIEEELAARVFRLLEAVLRLGVTSTSPCYRTDVISSRAGTVKELAALLNVNRK